jgi:formamidopyrimidine-DNA glycosylase
MPELPEVQTTVDGLQSIVGTTVESINIINPNLRWPIQKNKFNKLINLKLHSISRRAKYIELDFGPYWLIIHLGMTGRLFFLQEKVTLSKHDHVLFSLKKPSQALIFNDVRRFGSMHLVEKNKLNKFFLYQNLGPEPLLEDFNTEYLFKVSRNKKISAKSLIMNSKYVVGVGNIYANEALFLSKIKPSRIAQKLKKWECEELVTNIKKILKLAIKKGGTTIKDFMNPNQGSGYFQINLSVYGKENLPCPICGSKILRTVQNQRSSFYCPICQI